MNRLPQMLSVEVVHAARRTLRRPGFMLISSITLGLALGASVMAFAILYGYLFRPLPYASPGRLLIVRQQLLKVGLRGPQVSVKFYHTLKQLPQFRNAGLFTFDANTVTANSRHSYAQYADVTPSTMTLLGVKPLLGRTLSDASGVPNGPREVVLSYAYWQTAFGGKTDVLGKTLDVGGTPMQVVGVMPKHFVFPMPDTSFYVPFVITPALAQDGNINYEMLTRMPQGWNLQRVNVLLATVRDRELRTESPATQAQAHKDGYVVDAVSYRDALLAYAGGTAPFWGLLAITLLLLFLAIVNSMNLALARQRQRLGELQLRQILGASLIAILRMTVLEYAPLLIGTAVIAAVFALWGIGMLHAYQLPSAQMPFVVHMGAPSIGFLIAIALIAVGCVTGSALAAGLTVRRSAGAVQELTPRGSASRAFRQVQRVFAALQICLALVLVITSVLLSQSLIGLLNQPVHFESEHVTVAQVMLPQTSTPQDFWNQAKSALERLPGTQSAALTNMVPFGTDYVGGEYYATGHRENIIWTYSPMVSAGFFDTLGVHPLAGRLFGPTDERAGANNVIISTALAQALFGRTDVVGETLDGNLHIIGVVPPLPWSLDPASNHHGYALYLPLNSYPFQMVRILVKSTAAPAILTSAIRRTLASVEPGAVLLQTQTLPQIRQQASLNRSALTWLVVGFGGLAFLIAVFGVYAIVAYGTRLRLFEFAIRQVLGATRGAVVALTLRETALLLLVGGVVGLLIAYVIARGLQSLLYGVGTLDPLAYVGSLALIVVAVLIAAALPAWRATLKNPADIMREQP